MAKASKWDLTTVIQVNIILEKMEIADKDLILETVNCEGAVKTSVTLYGYLLTTHFEKF